MQEVVVVLGDDDYNSVVEHFDLPIINANVYTHSIDVLIDSIFNRHNVRFVLFTGGEDVSPSLYTSYTNKNIQCNRHRDENELRIFGEVAERYIPHAGICRGSQFLCAMNGGLLIQDTDYHALSLTHPIQVKVANTLCKIQVTSTHHQMQYPFNLKDRDYNILGYATNQMTEYLVPPSKDLPEDLRCEHEPSADKYYDYIYEPLEKEPEIVYYNKHKSLAIQYHPEYMKKDSDGFKLAVDLITQVFNREKIHVKSL
jgi:gamma-glutamyl-gamma-aminobutyrate hydrolase PuuD